MECRLVTEGIRIQKGIQCMNAYDNIKRVHSLRQYLRQHSRVILHGECAIMLGYSRSFEHHVFVFSFLVSSKNEAFR